MTTFHDQAVRWLALIASSTDHDRFAIIAETPEDATSLLLDTIRVLPAELAYATTTISQPGRTATVFGRRVHLIDGRTTRAEHRLRGLTLRGLWLHGNLPERVVHEARWRVQRGEVFVSAEVREDGRHG